MPAYSRVELACEPRCPLPVLSELHIMVSFSRPPGPCLIQTEITKGSLRSAVTTPSGIFTAWVPLNSKTWSLSWPLSVESPTVQLVALLGDGSSSAVFAVVPKYKHNDSGQKSPESCQKGFFLYVLLWCGQQWTLENQHRCLIQESLRNIREFHVV